jgi:hypothetical protein
MKNPISDFNAPYWRQSLLKLTRIVIFDDRHRLVCIPDRMSAENERDKLKRKHGTSMIAANINKNGKGKTGTYTLAYTLRESRTEDLF